MVKLSSIQESTLEAAVLVARRDCYQASELLGCIIQALYKKREEFVPSANTSTCTEMVHAEGLVIVPVSKNYEITCPEWDDEFFQMPFTFYVSDEIEKAEHSSQVTELVAAFCTSTCLFNIALCYHLEAMDEGGDSNRLLSEACKFYGQAWTCLTQYGDVDHVENASLLLVAISINMSKCCYYMGSLDASNKWLGCLRKLLGAFVLSDDDLVLEIHNFFLMASAVNTGCIAAGAA